MSAFFVDDEPPRRPPPTSVEFVGILTIAATATFFLALVALALGVRW